MKNEEHFSDANGINFGTPVIAKALVDRAEKHVRHEAISGFGMKTKAQTLIDLIRSAMFPNIYDVRTVHEEHYVKVAEEKLGQAAILLDCMISEVLVNTCEREKKNSDHECCRCHRQAHELTKKFIFRLPGIVDILNTDIAAAFEETPLLFLTKRFCSPIPDLKR